MPLVVALKFTQTCSLLATLLRRFEGLLHSGRALLPCNHELEAVEVGHLGAGFPSSELLCPSGGLPLADDVIPLQGSLQCLLTSPTWDLALEVREAQATHWHHVAAHSCGCLRAINNNSLLIHNVDHSAHLAGTWAVGDECKATRLDKSVKHGADTRVDR